MSEQTFHTTTQDIRKPESKISQAHQGNPPKDSDVSAMKSVLSDNANKKEQIDKAKSNLPLPDQPPVASDWSSADQRTVNVGSGGLEGPISGEANSALREPATAGSSVREDGAELHKNTQPTGNVGRQAAENLSGLPKDALAR
ncbi:hypothetical protein ETB97_001590 [Aspergillus alliaceus]|uniref:SMP domain-containing protein n=1 Tax=Petromyces alliaceus TaxID=209559 RepID=A0A5N7CA84_PETAA|nr:uncharacterized protein BDW43DRAFT_265312 [Aspergillus alliaceus]KAB8237369.1 hypothetical protein BDW43DRAFT_265312 [Aspergillus alliaceus]KAE8391025.1 hypothetical protein BDV23DRAFT_153930 [Aspergillus alliaceus]KAF5860428.1 hypothetical protein ETB97_001590 [Aspergillus burnettii]